jgi:hypothetical protein
MVEEKKDENEISDAQRRYIESLIKQISDPNERLIWSSEYTQLQNKQQASEFITRLVKATQSQPKPTPQPTTTQQPQTFKLNAAKPIDNREFKQELLQIAEKYNLQVSFYRITETDNGISISIRFYREKNSG